MVNVLENFGGFPPNLWKRSLQLQSMPSKTNLFQKRSKIILKQGVKRKRKKSLISLFSLVILTVYSLDNFPCVPYDWELKKLYSSQYNNQDRQFRKQGLSHLPSENRVCHIFHQAPSWSEFSNWDCWSIMYVGFQFCIRW